MSGSADEIPVGWHLGCESWSFHRQFFDRVGRPAVYREYAAILWQIRHRSAERLSTDIYRVTLADGHAIIVRCGWRLGLRVLLGVKPPDWEAPAAPLRDVIAQVPVATAVHIASPDPIADAPVTRRPLRASTLTLSNPPAERALAARLRRFGLQAEAIGRVSSI